MSVMQFEGCDIRKHVGARIRKARLNARLSQRQLAEFSDLSRSTVKSVERGTHSAGLLTLEALSVALNCSVSMLVGTDELEIQNEK